MSPSVIRAVTFVNEQIAWGVGTDGYIGYWDGQEWKQVASPATRTLNDVAFFAPDHGVAVGEKAQLLHWDGKNWSLIYSHEEPYYSFILNDVSFVSATEIWAVGLITSGPSWPLIKRWHWDGQTWLEREVNLELQCTCSLYSILILSEADIWVVGFDDYNTVTMHWDGTQWALIPNPYANSGKSWLYSVSGTATNDVWATGVTGELDLTLIHWDGIAWNTVTPGIQGSSSQVLMITPTQGYVVLSNAWGIVCWDGQTWTKAEAEFPDPPAYITTTPGGKTLILTRNGLLIPFSCS